MEIEEFVGLSKGVWRSMRSGHSLAFQQFEEVIIGITITLLNTKDQSVKDLMKSVDFPQGKWTHPFLIEWTSESDWEEEGSISSDCGKSILIPFPKSETSGLLALISSIDNPSNS